MERQEEPSPMSAPGIFNAPKPMFGTSPSADPCFRRAKLQLQHIRAQPPEPCQMGARAGPASPQTPPQEDAASGAQPSCLLSPDKFPHLGWDLICQGAKSQPAARVGRAVRLSVAFQWVQAPKPGEKRFLLICDAQSTDTTDFLVTQ